MRFKLYASLAIGICFVPILAIMTGAVRSQDRGAVSSGISYQGFLTDMVFCWKVL